MAEGFVEAKMLAKKFASLYYLLEDLLSPAKYALPVPAVAYTIQVVSAWASAHILSHQKGPPYHIICCSER